MKRFSTALLLIFALTAPAFAQTGPALMLKPWGKDQNVGLAASALVMGSHVKGSDSSFTLASFRSGARFRLLPATEGGLSAGFDLTYLNINSGDAKLPPRLVDQSIGLGENFGAYDGWKIGASGAVGYAGNNPFADGNAWYLKADLFGVKTLDAKSQLRIIFDYDGNRSIFPDVPLPMISYTHVVNKQLSFNIGVPYNSVNYTPNDRWSFQVDYYLPVTVNARATYHISSQWSAYGAFNNRFYSFHDSEYAGHTRLFFRQRRLEAGVKWQTKSQLSVTLAGGYAFGQQFEKGFHILNTETVRDVADAPYIRAAVTWSF